MMHVATVPASFDDRALDPFAAGLGVWPPPERLLVDARGTTWASPYGLVALLTLGQALTEAGGPKPRLAVPDAEDTRGYWARVGFFHHALEYFELIGKIPRRGGEAPTGTVMVVELPAQAARKVPRSASPSPRRRSAPASARQSAAAGVGGHSGRHALHRRL